MLGEIYVTHLLASSPTARDIAMGMSWLPLDRDLLEFLRDPDEVRQTAVRFESLAVELSRRLTAPQLPHFTEGELKSLVRLPTRTALATVFGCDTVDVFSNVLDPEPIRLALLEAGIAMPPNDDADSLLLHVLADANLAQIRRRHAAGPNDWGWILDDEGWILPSALSVLAEECGRRGLLDGSAPRSGSRLLAAIVNDIAPPAGRVRADEIRIDALGAVEILRRVARLVEELRNEAIAHAERAMEQAPGLPELRRLKGWIELYECRSLSRGLPAFLGGTTPLSALVGKAEVTVPPVAGPPVPDEPLILDDIEQYRSHLFGRRYATCRVYCRVAGSTEPTPILTLKRLPADALPLLAVGIPRLRGVDLALVGDTLGERLLATGLTSPKGVAGLLRHAVTQHLADVVQTIALTGIDQPVTAAVPWKRDLADRLDRTPARTDDRIGPADGQDVELPRDVRSIADELVGAGAATLVSDWEADES